MALQGRPHRASVGSGSAGHARKNGRGCAVTTGTHHRAQMEAGDRVVAPSTQPRGSRSASLSKWTTWHAAHGLRRRYVPRTPLRGDVRPRTRAPPRPMPARSARRDDPMRRACAAAPAGKIAPVVFDAEREAHYPLPRDARLKSVASQIAQQPRSPIARGRIATVEHVAQQCARRVVVAKVQNTWASSSCCPASDGASTGSTAGVPACHGGTTGSAGTGPTGSERGWSGGDDPFVGGLIGRSGIRGPRNRRGHRPCGQRPGIESALCGGDDDLRLATPRVDDQPTSAVSSSTPPPHSHGVPPAGCGACGCVAGCCCATAGPTTGVAALR